MVRRRFTPPVLERTAAARERAREKILAQTPRWYSPWAHLAGTTGVGVATLAAGALRMHAVTPTEFAVVPLTFLLANAFEWRVHKNVLHRPLWPIQVIYRKHTPEHHAIYHTHDMAIRNVREFRLVLIPAAGVLGSVLAATPLALGLAWLWSANAGWLFLVTTACYMVSYELLHLAFHQPDTSFLGSRKLVRWLRYHHAVHHDPRLMHRWNFNVTFPIWDWLHGTIYKGDDVTNERDENALAPDRERLPSGRVS
jgi:hypothetical protein